MMKREKGRYTVSRCKLDNTLIGLLHESADVQVTRCGRKIDKNWWVVTNDGKGRVSCPACLRG